jgi:hypothetical protein
MRPYRIALVVTGSLLFTLGVFRLVTGLAAGDLVALMLWLVVAVALHDVVIAPLTVGVGLTLTRLPARARRYVQGALVVGALITVVALPLIHRRNSQPTVKAILLRDYAGNLALLLGLTAAVALVLYAARVFRDGGDTDPTRHRARDGALEDPPH